jgi:UDP-N-acetylglucosamine transferase subunit ALG13
LIAPVVERVYVQSLDLVGQVRGSHYVGRVPVPVLSTRRRVATATAAEPKQVLLTVGANTRYPFDRLLQAAELILAPNELLVQCGVSAVRPTRASCVSFLPFEELVNAARYASVIVTHAGIGSVMLALAAGKRPIVMPRRRYFGESVDDHQVAFAERLASEGLALAIDGPDDLPAALTAAQKDAWRGTTSTGPSGLERELLKLLQHEMAPSDEKTLNGVVLSRA